MTATGERVPNCSTDPGTDRDRHRPMAPPNSAPLCPKLSKSRRRARARMRAILLLPSELNRGLVRSRALWSEAGPEAPAGDLEPGPVETSTAKCGDCSLSAKQSFDIALGQCGADRSLECVKEKLSVASCTAGSEDSCAATVSDSASRPCTCTGTCAAGAASEANKLVDELKRELDFSYSASTRFAALATVLVFVVSVIFLTQGVDKLPDRLKSVIAWALGGASHIRLGEEYKLSNLVSYQMDQWLSQCPTSKNRVDDLNKGKSDVLETGHIIIVGWSLKIFTVISEICIGKEPLGGCKLAILSELDKEEMEERIAAHCIDTRNSKIICRTGDPLLGDHLNKVSVKCASAIIVLSTEANTEHNDARMLRIVINLLNMHRSLLEANMLGLQGHIVAEVGAYDSQVLVTQIAQFYPGASKKLHLMATSDITSRIMLNCMRCPYMGQIISMLVGFEGSEFYFAGGDQRVLLAEDETGDQLVMLAEDETGDQLVMLAEDETGDQLVMLAEDETGDQLVLLAEDETGVHPLLYDAQELVRKHSKTSEGLSHSLPPKSRLRDPTGKILFKKSTEKLVAAMRLFKPQEMGRLMICGWRPDMGGLRLDNNGACPSLKHVRVRYKDCILFGSTLSRPTMEQLDPLQFSCIMIVTDDSENMTDESSVASSRDSNSLATVFKLRSIQIMHHKRQRSQNADPPKQRPSLLRQQRPPPPLNLTLTPVGEALALRPSLLIQQGPPPPLIPVREASDSGISASTLRDELNIDSSCYDNMDAVGQAERQALNQWQTDLQAVGDKCVIVAQLIDPRTAQIIDDVAVKPDRLRIFNEFFSPIGNKIVVLPASHLMLVRDKLQKPQSFVDLANQASSLGEILIGYISPNDKVTLNPTAKWAEVLVAHKSGQKVEEGHIPVSHVVVIAYQEI
eukprot:gene13327-19167_t